MVALMPSRLTGGAAGTDIAGVDEEGEGVWAGVEPEITFFGFGIGGWVVL